VSKLLELRPGRQNESVACTTDGMQLSHRNRAPKTMAIAERYFMPFVLLFDILTTVVSG